MALWITILPMEIKLCCRVLGTATFRNLPQIFPENRGAFFVVLIARSLLKTNNRDSRQLTPWQINVAQATPATPMWRPATNQISMAILEQDEAARKKKGVLESPSAEKMPLEIL